jgi:dGTPase
LSLGIESADTYRDYLVQERAKPRAQRRLSSPDENVSDSEYRTPYERDRDRLLYSSSFRRLAGITQITSVTERHLLHNRLTHSLKVGQLGRRMGERLCRQYPELDELADLMPDAVETAGLAHDLGHPPFGHTVEDVLHDLTKDRSGGFEGNAQTFRIVTKVATRALDSERSPVPGLDLTRVSLNAILKYPQFRRDGATKVDPWTDRSRGDKWGAYKSEQQDVLWADESRADGLKTGGLLVRSANAVLMDWADDISFATHDIEDYIRAGLIPLEKLLSAELTEFQDYAKGRLAKKPSYEDTKYVDAFDTVRGHLEEIGGFHGRRAERARLAEKTSDFIQLFVNAVMREPDPPYISVAPEVQYQVEILKALTWFYVIDTPSVATTRHGQAQLMRQLFEILENFLRKWVEKGSSGRDVPVTLRDLYTQCVADAEGSEVPSDSLLLRAVADYICTLTEEQTLDLFQRMTGTSRASIFGTWFQ